MIVLFLLLIWRGVRISMNAPDMIGKPMAIGITSLVAIETIINIAVVTATLPVTGMPLPFISYGELPCCSFSQYGYTPQYLQETV